jgi:methyl-accepting chemotaxis protein
MLKGQVEIRICQALADTVHSSREIVMNIVLVGGGKAAVILLNFFDALKDATIIGVSDTRDDAPGMVRARSLGIATTTRTDEMIQQSDAKIIIELTGSSKVQEGLAKLLRPGQHIMSAECAKLMCNMIEAQAARNASIADRISGKFSMSANQLGAAIEKIDVAYTEVEKLLREAGMVALNAKIESARAGDAGNAFAIVVDRIHEMLNSIRGAMEKISIASTDSHDTLANLTAAENQLADVFHLSQNK